MKEELRERIAALGKSGLSPMEVAQKALELLENLTTKEVKTKDKCFYDIFGGLMVGQKVNLNDIEDDPFEKIVMAGIVPTLRACRNRGFIIEYDDISKDFFYKSFDKAANSKFHSTKTRKHTEWYVKSKQGGHKTEVSYDLI